MSRTRTARRLIDGQQLALLPLTIEEDGAQLDLVALVGVETIGPRTLRTPAHNPHAERLAALGCGGCINAAHRH